MTTVKYTPLLKVRCIRWAMMVAMLFFQRPRVRLCDPLVSRIVSNPLEVACDGCVPVC